MIDDGTYVQVLRDEVSRLYTSNLELQARIISGSNDLQVVIDFLDRIDTDWLEARALSHCGLGVKTTDAIIGVLREVASAELGERTS